MSYYDILGIDRSASEDDIKKAYRSLAKRFHPDANNGSDETKAKFQEISEAYEILSNPEKRRDYDNPIPPGMGFPSSIFDMFKQGFGVNFFGERPPPSPIPTEGSQRGQDLRMLVAVTPFHLLLEKEMGIKYNRLVPCPVCEGRGADLKHCPTCEGYGIKREVLTTGHQRRVSDSPCYDCGQMGIIKENICDNCKGSGLVMGETEVPLIFNASHSGGTLVSPGLGNFGPYKGTPGDLIIQLKIDFPTKNQINIEAKEKLEAAYNLIFPQG